MRVEASAPSNIALIKYMGKTTAHSNLPANVSLSYTLEHLRSFVTLEEHHGSADEWRPLDGFPVLELSEAGQKKFLAHFHNLKKMWNISGSFLLRSANNFPADCGLASSASSFAALTLAAAELASRKQSARGLDDMEMLSRVSRRGSGSSCRSFFSPWAVWRGEGAERLSLPLTLEHAVVIVADAKKSVSSSEAHQRVNTSLLFTGRPERAELRANELIKALQNEQWPEAFELCWSEFWDMHALFETSRPSFGYINAQTQTVLTRLREIWQKEGDGPLVTMDAGANVHLLLRHDQITKAREWLRDWQVLSSWELN